MKLCSETVIHTIALYQFLSLLSDVSWSVIQETIPLEPRPSPSVSTLQPIYAHEPMHFNAMEKCKEALRCDSLTAGDALAGCISGSVFLLLPLNALRQRQRRRLPTESLKMDSPGTLSESQAV